MAKLARSTVESSTLGVGVLLVLVLVGMLNYFGWKYYRRFDWTADELYSLSEKSENVVGSLDRPIEAVVFLSPGDPLFEAAEELLSRYAAASPRFTVRKVDPEKNLVEAQSLVNEFGLSHLDVIVFDSGDDRRVIETADLAEYDYSGLQQGRSPEMTEFKGEEVFTSTVLDLMERRKPKILFTTGHGELSLDDTSPRGLDLLQARLGGDNFDLEEWSSLGATDIPADTDLVVVAGPSRGFAASEAALLSEFAAGGGRLLLLLDPIIGGLGASADAGSSPGSNRVAPTGLEGLLADYGVILGRDIVIDPASPIPFFGAETFFVGSYGDHPVTKPLRQAEIPVIVPLARSLELAGNAAELGATILAQTSPEGWGERDLETLDQVAKGSEDLAGPVAIGVAIERDAQAASGAGEGVEEDGSETALAAEASVDPATDTAVRLAVFGDTDFASNSQLRNVGNAELISNTVNWLVERATLIAIPPKKPEQVRLSLTSSELRTIGLLVFLVLPGLSVVVGIGVFSRRRR